MTPAVGSQSGTGYYADWHGNVTGVYSDLPRDLDALLDNNRLAKHPDARYLTDGVDEAPGHATARMSPHAGQDGIDGHGQHGHHGQHGIDRVDLTAAQDPKQRKQLEERLFGLDPTSSCSNCSRAAVACICGMFSDLAPKLKAPPPPAAGVSA